jgi:CDP-glucose 4,6-dehydratase
MKRLFGGIYCSRRVLVTGHTGFKGSWLALWLDELGACVSGLSLPPPTVPSHFELLKLNIDSHIYDITNGSAVRDVFRQTRPEVVFHLAAQPLVLRSYEEPVETFRTNVQGLVNVLEACRLSESVQAVVVVTSDKCYENQDWPWPYRESDRLGGYDPYSASKAAAEIVSHSYGVSFFERAGRIRLATARAGNVIGGGDWAADRLLPDIARAVQSGGVLRIRCPSAIRPWQHVLECLSGYLTLGESLLLGNPNRHSAWNFGPDVDACRTVQEIVAEVQGRWPAVRWALDNMTRPAETRVLQLDTSLAREELRWKPVWDWRKSVAETVQWYSAHARGEVITRSQLAAYADDARRAGACWTPCCS